MKKTAVYAFALISAILIALSSFGVFAAETTAYEIDDIRMSISIPNDMLVVTKESRKTDSYFSQFKLNYKKTMEDFEKNDIYLQAMKEDLSVMLSVSVTETDDSREISSYSSISEDQLDKIISDYNKSKLYKSGFDVTFNGIKYICLVEKGDKSYIYNTVFGGKNYNIHFTVQAKDKVSKNDKALFESIMGSVNILEDNFVNNNRDLLIYVGASLIGVLLVAVVVFIVLRKTKGNPDKKHSELVHELAHEHKISETTRIPRKTIEQITEPTMTFLENYKPVEEISDKKASVPAKSDTAKYVSVKPETEKEDYENVTVIAAEARKAAAEAMAAKMEQEAVALPRAERESEPEKVTEAEPQTETAETADESFESSRDYFEEDYSVKLYSVDSKAPQKEQEEQAPAEVKTEPDNLDVEDDTDDDYYEEEEHYESHIAENTKKVFAAIGRGILTALKAIGRGLAKFFSGLWTVIVFIIVHCKYFCINLSRAIKRKHNIRKRKKLDEKRREQAQQKHREELAQRRAYREAQRERQRANAARGANDLVKVHSSGERRPVNRNVQRPSSERTAYPRNRKR